MADGAVGGCVRQLWVLEVGVLCLAGWRRGRWQASAHLVGAELLPACLPACPLACAKRHLCCPCLRARLPPPQDLMYQGRACRPCCACRLLLY